METNINYNIIGVQAFFWQSFCYIFKVNLNYQIKHYIEGGRGGEIKHQNNISISFLTVDWRKLLEHVGLN